MEKFASWRDHYSIEFRERFNLASFEKEALRGLNSESFRFVREKCPRGRRDWCPLALVGRSPCKAAHHCLHRRPWNVPGVNHPSTRA